jgi:hypothetical protein
VESTGGKGGVGWRTRGRIPKRKIWSLPKDRERPLEEKVELAKMFDEKATRGKCNALLQY